jgi:uncharacterized membrane protein HdeD (DUF308 family)
MTKGLTYFLVIVIGLILFVFVMITFEANEMNLWGSVLLLYAGSVFLVYSNSDKSSMNGIRFRLILVGIFALIAGIVMLISYFF